MRPPVLTEAQDQAIRGLPIYDDGVESVVYLDKENGVIYKRLKDGRGQPYFKDHGTIAWGLKTQRRLNAQLPNAKVISVRKRAGTGAPVAGQTSAVSSEGTPPPPSNLPAGAGAGNGVETRAPSTSQPDTGKSKPSLPPGKSKRTGIAAESGQRAVPTQIAFTGGAIALPDDPFADPAQSTPPLAAWGR